MSSVGQFLMSLDKGGRVAQGGEHVGSGWQFLVLRFAFREVIRREERTNLQLVKRELMHEAQE